MLRYAAQRKHCSMPINPAPVLLVCADPEKGQDLFSKISRADIDVVFAATALEALYRLRQFQVAAAVVAWQEDIQHLIPTLEKQHVPFYVYGLPPAGATVCGQPLIVADIEHVVPTLMNLLSVQ